MRPPSSTLLQINAWCLPAPMRSFAIPCIWAPRFCFWRLPSHSVPCGRSSGRSLPSVRSCGDCWRRSGICRNTCPATTITAERRPIDWCPTSGKRRRMTDSPPQWSLHPQLEQDAAVVGDLPLSRLLLSNDANYPWLLLVPRRPGVGEIIDLDEKDQSQLMIEIAHTSRSLKNVTACHKLNVAAIGNVVPQLHIHIVARQQDDPAWPKPVWGAVPARAYDPAARERFIATLRHELRIE